MNVKKTLQASVLAMAVAGTTNAFADMATGQITLLGVGNVIYTPATMISLVVVIDDAAAFVSGNSYYDDCNGTLIAPLIVNTVDLNEVDPSAGLYQSMLTTAYTTAKDVSVDYVVEEDYLSAQLGYGITACVISNVYFSGV